MLLGYQICKQQHTIYYVVLFLIIKILMSKFINKLTICYFALFLFVFCFAAKAQQDAQYSQYMYNQLYVNPAVAGLNPKFAEVGITHRQQWMGYAANFDTGGSPISTLAYGSVPVKFLHGGIGLYVQNDRLGPLNNFAASLSYAFHEQIENGTISAGIQGGIYNMSIDWSMLRPREPGDALLIGRDQSQIRPDFGLGLQLTKKKYYIGASLNHVTRPTFSFGGADASRLNIHTNITGGLNFDLGQSFAIKPSAIVRTDFKAVSMQATVMATYQDFINFGIGMRNSFGVDDAIAFVGINLLKDKSLHIGYSFDYVISGVTAKAPTSSEIILRYNIPMPIPVIPPVIRTPRFRF